MSKSKIEWTEVTWNPVLGCAKVSEGCRNCYAMSMSARIANAAQVKDEQSPVEKGYMDIVKRDENGKYLPKWTGTVALIEDRLEDPLKWQKPRKVFVNSMSDLFHPDVPFEFIDKVFAVMAMTPQHVYQILTKRPERMKEYFRRRHVASYVREQMNIISDVYQEWIEWPLPNVWLGTSVEDQRAADERIQHLLQCPAKVRFLSCEPLLGPVDLTDVSYGNQLYDSLKGIADLDPTMNESIHWVIVGGESGHNARPMGAQWVKDIRDQCREADVPFFFKQWGKWLPQAQYQVDVSEVLKEHPKIPTTPKAHIKFVNGEYDVFIDMGKKKAGNLLNGEKYLEMPEGK